ncbi:hypothetical protein NLI96_g7598 [Meripilus lineatus]|uniref:Uncharacterized protein n=1 Tax=Meripilus lineatus TaxID=2056292 RepID=A0AAD5UYW3_9APHY|nr:hypothetical protein NLI96_g7598 [Physisporinus lineatus]
MRKSKSNRRSSSNTVPSFDTTLLDPSDLRSEEALQGVIRTLEGHLRFLDEDGRARLVDDLLDIQNGFEFVMAVLRDDIASQIISWIVKSFPSKAGWYLDSPQAYLTERLAEYLRAAPGPLAGLTNERRSAFKKAKPCLQIIHEMLTADGYFAQQPTSRRRKRKDSRKGTGNSHARAFQDLSEVIPTTREEALSLESILLNKQKETLQAFLEILKDVRYQETFKAIYVSAEFIRLRASNAPRVMFSSREREENDSFGCNSPDKRKHSEPIEGFGGWKVLISDRADGALRILHWKDFRLFGLILEQLRELSHGRFSEDIQFLLTNENIPIHIYHAGVSRDTVIINVNAALRIKVWSSFREYCILATKYPIVLVLWILDIEPRSNINLNFWDLAAKALSMFGAEYIRRCSVRSTRPHGSAAISPVTFPPAPDPRIEENEDEHTGRYVFDVEVSPEARKGFTCQIVKTDRALVPALETLMNYRGSRSIVDIMTNTKESSYLSTSSQQEVVTRLPTVYTTQEGPMGEKTTHIFRLHHPSHTADPRRTLLEDVGEASQLLGQNRRTSIHTHSEVCSSTVSMSSMIRTPEIGLPDVQDVPKLDARKGIPSMALSSVLRTDSSHDRAGDSSLIDIFDTISIGDMFKEQETSIEYSYTEFHHEAARVIQRAIRRKRNRQSVQPTHGLQIRKNEVYQQYFQATKYIGWLSPRHKLLFLGALPHLLFCVKEIRTFAQKQKSKAKKSMLTSASTKDLGILSLDDATKLVKVAERLYRELEPGSDIHWKKDWNGLEAAVKKLSEIMENSDTKVSEPLRHDFEVGSRATHKAVVLLLNDDGGREKVEVVPSRIDQSTPQLEFGFQIW